MERLILNPKWLLVIAKLEPLQSVSRPGIGVDNAVIYSMHRSLLYLEEAGNALRVMFFTYPVLFNTIQLSLLRGKLEGQITVCEAPGLYFWSGSLQHGGSTGDSARSLSVHSTDFHYNLNSCHIQKFSDDSVIVGRVPEWECVGIWGGGEGLCSLAWTQSPSHHCHQDKGDGDWHLGKILLRLRQWISGDLTLR